MSCTNRNGFAALWLVALWKNAVMGLIPVDTTILVPGEGL